MGGIDHEIDPLVSQILGQPLGIVEPADPHATGGQHRRHDLPGERTHHVDALVDQPGREHPRLTGPAEHQHAHAHDTRHVREILVIGIGPGHPDQLTVQAVDALNRVQVFFVVDKGSDKDGLLAARQRILQRHVRDPDGYRVVEIDEPPRDRSAADYPGAVDDWYQLRAERFAAAIVAELDSDGCRGVPGVG